MKKAGLAESELLGQEIPKEWKNNSKSADLRKQIIKLEMAFNNSLKIFI